VVVKPGGLDNLGGSFEEVYDLVRAGDHRQVACRDPDHGGARVPCRERAERGPGEPQGGNGVTAGLQAPDDGAPAGSVGPCPCTKAIFG
jgi:hypothetical protein